MPESGKKEGNMRSNELTIRIRREIDAMPIIDAHGHILPLEESLRFHKDLATLIYHAYGDWDIWQYDKDLLFGTNGHDRFWDLAAEGGRYTPEIGKKRILPIIRKIQNTAFYRSTIHMLRLVYGVDCGEVDESNYDEIDGIIQQRRLTEKRYWDMVSGNGSIKKMVLNLQRLEDLPQYKGHPIFTYVLGMNNWVKPARPALVPGGIADHLALAARETDTEIATIEDYLHAMDLYIAKVKAQGCIGAKLGFAYLFPFEYEEQGRGAAAACFSKAKRGEALDDRETSALESYLLFSLAQRLGAQEMILQIHTGLVKHEANIAKVDPAIFYALYRSCPKTKFDLFHAGYPHHEKLGAMAKSLPNVFANMCWMPLISQKMTHDILSEWLEVVSAGKIIGFGSDMIFPEIMAAHFDLAKKIATDVLCEKIESGYISERAALDFARIIFYESPCELYGIEQGE